ncbi:MAG: hypothetical protein WCQ99_08985 [Pseudomonadota bacterium]
MKTTTMRAQSFCIIFFSIVLCSEQFGLFRIIPYVCEDAYITFRFSRNFAEGFGPVFNSGDHVEGYSNFLWMSSLALVHWLGFDMISFSRIAGAIFNTLSFLLVWYIPCRFFSIRGLAGFFGPLLYILFLPVHFYAASGLETSLYTFLILLSLYAVLGARERPLPFGAAGAIFLLIALTRPEGILFFIFFCAYRAWRSYFFKEPLRPYLPGIMLCIAGYSAFMLWRFSYYGLPLPNTYYAKGSLPIIERFLFGFFINKGFLTHYPLFLILLPFFLFIKIPADRRQLMPLFIVIAAGALFSIGFSGFDWMPFIRYNIPIIPPCIICCQLVFSEAWRSLALKKERWRKPAGVLATLLILLIAAEQFFQDYTFTLRWRDLTFYGRHNQRVVGEWIKKELAGSPSLAMGDVGYLAYVSQARIIDIFGLTTRKFAEIKSAHGAPDVNFFNSSISFDTYKKKERELLLQLAPEYVFLYNARLKISDTYPGSVAGIADQPDFLEKYDYMTTFYIIPRFTAPAWPRLHHAIDVLDLSAGLLAWFQNGWGYDIFVRKDSPCKRFTFEFSADEKITAVVVKK